VIAILDYGMGNLPSLVNMFRRSGIDAQPVQDVGELRTADKLVLPGVGAFDAAMSRINGAPGLRDTLEDLAMVRKIPVLGVCLGMHLLTRSSEEGALPGLGWVGASTVRFPRSRERKVPHMGWNVARPTQSSPITDGVGDEPRYYFVHSFYVKADHQSSSIMSTEYGLEFDAAISHENIFGVQFHPEKSHRFGMQILHNFGNL
jgi:imidazole glycerol-phosphate synthase subunit HisH